MNNNPMHQQYQGSYHPMDGDIKSQSQRYMNYHVMAQGNDGSQFDGIIESMDDNGVTMLVLEEFDADQARIDEQDKERQFNFGYGGYDSYGRPRRRRHRRYHRRRFPFNFFVGFYPYPFPPFFPWY